MKNLKIGPRLLTSFLIIAAFSLVLGIVGIISSSILSNQTSMMYDEPVIAINAISTIRGRFNNIRLNALEMARFSSDKAKLDEYYANVVEYGEEVDDAIATYEKTITDMSKETAYKNLVEAFPGYMDSMDDIYETAGSEGEMAALAMFDENDVEAANILSDIDDMAQYNIDIAIDLDQKADNISLIITIVQIAVIVVAVLAAIAIAVSVANGISVPIGHVTNVLKAIGTTGRTEFTDDEWRVLKELSAGSDETAECAEYCTDVANALNAISGILTKVANGDLTIEHQAMSNDDTISKSIILMLDNLNRMFGEIDQAAEQVSLGANQISDASQSLAEGSTEQAATVEELSASIQDVSEKTRKNADRADEASHMSANVKANAEKGASQMDEMTQAVTEINQASQNISKVIKVIDDIAFQTNILALNAAVEAARAGEAGKGFAVVADEVRNLASKSAAAAKETGALIENSMKKAELGSAIAADTASSLSEIVDGINKSTDLIAEIAESSKEQSLAISQINDGIMQVSEVVQKNSATAEECAASAEELNSQSVVLTDQVAKFSLRR
jgi:methyl-accepting chemotaxis protein